MEALAVDVVSVNDYSAIQTLELSPGGTDECTTEEDETRALQALVNSGTVWGLQGSYGRAAMGAIEAGWIALGTEPHVDAYGSRVPSRFEVQDGTKGSTGYVQERSPFGEVLDS